MQILLAVAALLHVATAAVAKRAAPNWSVRDVTYGGTGCPQGSAGDDPMNLQFPSLRATIGPSTSVTENRRICTVNVDIVYDAGWQFRLNPRENNQLRVRVRAGDGVTATYRTAYYFSGSSADQKVVEYKFKGPYDRVVELSDPYVGLTSAWSPCGSEGLFNVARQVRLSTTNKGSSGSINLQYEDEGQVIPYDSLEWQRC